MPLLNCPSIMPFLKCPFTFTMPFLNCLFSECPSSKSPFPFSKCSSSRRPSIIPQPRQCEHCKYQADHVPYFDKHIDKLPILKATLVLKHCRPTEWVTGVKGGVITLRRFKVNRGPYIRKKVRKAFVIFFTVFVIHFGDFCLSILFFSLHRITRVFPITFNFK